MQIKAEIKFHEVKESLKKFHKGKESFYKNQNGKGGYRNFIKVKEV